ncbi:MAG TPA: 30S ribosome-binding factor RbfA [Candidatus Brocadiia bacterium]|nr:30S ribosome-binding factor RbfA [Candidatus Brocadiia bacterium]
MPKGRRLERLTAILKQELGAIIAFQLKDPRVGFATVTRIKLASDLTQVQVFVSVLGPEAQERAAMRALNHARGHIQSLIADRIDIRRHPEITFHLDRGLKHSLRVSQILTELAHERGEDETPAAPEAGMAGDADLGDGETSGFGDQDEDLDENDDEDGDEGAPSHGASLRDGRPPPAL